MKQRYLIVFLSLLVFTAVPAYGVTIDNFTGVVTKAVGNPFGVTVGTEVPWSVQYDFVPSAVGPDELLFNQDPNNQLFIKVGTIWQIQQFDQDYGSGFPRLLFNDGSVSGLDFTSIAFPWPWGTIGSTYVLSTYTPLPTSTPDFATFSVFEFTSGGDRVELISGNLFQHVVPIPAPALLLGTGLVGLACFRRKKP